VVVEERAGDAVAVCSAVGELSGVGADDGDCAVFAQPKSAHATILVRMKRETIGITALYRR
jgi:hypothetical protein